SDVCTAAFVYIVVLLEEVAVGERSFPVRTGHVLYLFLALALMARAHDELVGRLVRASALALRRLAPRGDRMTATRGATLTTTVRVVDRVHGDTAVVRTLAAPAGAARLTIVDVGVFRVGNSADRCEAGTVDDTLLTRVEAQDCRALVTTDQLSVCTSRTGNLTALARLHLDVMHDRTDRHRRKRHSVARLHVDALASHNLVTDSQTLRSQDIGQLTIIVLDQRDESGAVRVVLKTLNRCRNVELATLEVDQTIRTLVAATNEASRNTTVVVAAALLGQTFGQTLHRLALVETGTVHDYELARTRRNRIVV